MGKTIVVELPLVIGVLADLAGNDSVVPRRPFAERAFVPVDRDSFGDLFRGIGPGLSLEVANRLGVAGAAPTGDKTLAVTLRFQDLDDFTPIGIARQIPAVETLVRNRLELAGECGALARDHPAPSRDPDQGSGAERIVELDRVISAQLAEVLVHPEFQRLEAAWRGLHYLVTRSDTSDVLKIKVLDVAKQELALDLTGAVEIDQSQLFRKVYDDVYGRFRGEPFGLLVGDYEFGHRSEDFDLLAKIATVAAASFAPFVAAAAPQLLGVDHWRELTGPPALGPALAADTNIRWQSFRGSEDARFVALTMPRMLARGPYGHAVDGGSDGTPALAITALWMSAAWAYAQRVAESFALYGHPAATCGTEGGGLVAEWLPRTPGGRAVSEADAGRSPVEVILTDRQLVELSGLGLMALVACPEPGMAVFLDNPSCARPVLWNDSQASALAAASTRLPYTLTVSRFKHYIKAMTRDRIGGPAMNAEEVAAELNRWIRQYVDLGGVGGEQELLRLPLADAHVQVEEVAGKPGAYRPVVRLRPYFQLEDLTTNLRLVVDLPVRATARPQDAPAVESSLLDQIISASRDSDSTTFSKDLAEFVSPCMKGNSIPPSIKEIEHLIEGLERRIREEETKSPELLTLRRHTDISFPSRVKAGQSCNLRVQLVVAEEKLPDGSVRERPKRHLHDATLMLLAPQPPHAEEPPPPIRVTVCVTAENFEVRGPYRGEILVPPDGPSPAVHFDLCGQAVGPGRIMIDFSQEGRPVGSVDLTPEVVRDVDTCAGNPGPGADPVALDIRGRGEPAPDLVLKVFEHRLANLPGRLQFVLSSTNPALADMPVLDGDLGTLDLRADVAAWVEAQLQSLRHLAGRSDATAAEVAGVLAGIGCKLYDQILPPALQDLCWKFRRRGVRSLLILSDDPHIPWELVKPFRSDPVTGAIVAEEDHWGASYALTHWLRGRPPVARLSLQRVIAVGAGGTGPVPAIRDMVVPPPAVGPVSTAPASAPDVLDLGPLPSMEAELAVLRVLERLGAEVLRVPALRSAFCRAIEEGDFHLLHLAGHGAFSGAAIADTSAVLLDDGHMCVADLSPRMAASLRRRHPLIVFNTCSSTRLGFSLTRLGAWGAHFVQLGCGAFVGTLWPVTDRAALVFAQEFYESMSWGLPIGEAVLRARHRVRYRYPNDPTWLAYCCFADPMARIEKAAMADGEPLAASFG